MKKPLIIPAITFGVIFLLNGSGNNPLSNINYQDFDGIEIKFKGIRSAVNNLSIADRYSGWEKRFNHYNLLDSTDTTKKSIPLKVLPYGRDRWGNPFSSYSSSSPLLLNNPAGLQFDINLDTTGKYFNINEKIGNTYFRNPSRISFDEYKQLRYRNMDKEYWKSLSYSQDGQDDLTRGESNLIPKITLGPLADRLFGGNVVDIRPNGTLVGTLGYKWQKINNPQVPIVQQKTNQVDFDQQIGMNLVGKIGEKLQVSTNFNTKNIFSSEQKYKFGYTAFEEDIIQEVQLGNVNFSTSNSLITGVQSLFGLSTKLRFGKLWINAVASSQRGTTEQLVLQNGTQSKSFELQVSQYDNNRHFFLNHFFRENYNHSLTSLPVVSSTILVTNLEVYVTNRTNETQTLRSVTAYMDLGEAMPYNKSLLGKNQPADNDTNDLYDKVSGFRNPDIIASELESLGLGLRNGVDFEILNAAKKLLPKEYTFHPRLGYLSLVTSLQDDEVLAVSYSYSIGPDKYQVGELSRDYQNLNESNTVHLKLLSPSSISIDLPVWDLMMKNIYDLQSGKLPKENFDLKIIYKDNDTGNDNPSLQKGSVKNIPLVELLNADQLNQNNERQKNGIFDYVENVTVDVNNGRIIFPVLEPFGAFLENKFNETEQELINTYVFSELYNSTKNNAVNTIEPRSQYYLSGNIQSGFSNDIKLPGIDIAANSVSIKAGSTPLNEGQDYTVNYQFGSVKILNEAILNSGKEIIIQFERKDLLSFQTKNLFGIDAQYYLTKDIKFTGTFMHLSEKPSISRINIGSEVIKNSVLGMGIDFSSESRMLTKIVDKLPFISTKEKSNISFRAEVAQLRPKTPKLIGTSGTYYIDDFETTEQSYNLRKPNEWTLGSIPQLILNKGIDPNDALSYNYKRARLAWYSIDNIFYFNTGSNTNQKPPGVSDDLIELNHYVRKIEFDEVFIGKQATQGNINERSFDLAYYPAERGPYNYNHSELEERGDSILYFKNNVNLKDNFGAITKSITQNVDFDNINIQYIEFWMMDPFIAGANGVIPGRPINNNYSGGELYFNLGFVSEDLIPDGKHFFENGLKNNEVDPDHSESELGDVPSTQYLNNVFGENRVRQDVGFDGLNNENENARFQDFITHYSDQIKIDPSGDDFVHYNDRSINLDVFDRYKNNNNTEGNSSGDGNLIGSNFPDNEDLNRDNTVSNVEQYFEYKLDLNPSTMNIDHNKFIVDKITNEINGDNVDWFLFRIPIRTDKKENEGGISGFKSIKFLRMFMTGWDQPVVLRMVQFQLVGAQWRVYQQSLLNTDQTMPNLEPYDAGLTVSTVNIEENSSVNNESIPYDTPPGLERGYDLNSNPIRQLNEQSLRLCVDKLKNSDSRAVYKNVNLDFINYKRFKMEIHAESFSNNATIAEDDDLKAFIRFGTDFTENFYQIEVPLEITPVSTTIKEDIWPRSNEINIAFEDVLTVKSLRNRAKVNPDQIYPDPSITQNFEKYKISVKGNPDLSAVKTIMIGIKNPKTINSSSYNACLWLNELRVTDFDIKPGTALSASIQTKLADFATINASVKHSNVGYGNIQNRISERSRSTDLNYDISANVILDKFLLNKIGVSLPLFVSYEKETSDPKFDPLDKDTPLEISILKFDNEKEKEEYKEQAKDIFERKTISLTNVKKVKMKEGTKSHLWDIENITISATYFDSKRRNANLAEEITKNWKLGINYNFVSKGKAIEPFKKIKFLASPYLQLIKDFNINLIPTTVSVKGALNRSFQKTQNWNSNRTTENIDPNFQKSFIFNRDYSLRWQLSRNLSLDYSAKTNTIIDEPEGDIDAAAEHIITNNLKKLGRMKLFNQGISANYKIPLDKFPLTNWINTDTRYQAGYSWTAGAVNLVESTGHVLQNNNSIAVNGKIDLKKFYDKIPVLKKVNETKRKKRPTDLIKEANAVLRNKRKNNNDKVSKYIKKIKKIATKNNATIPAVKTDPKTEEDIILKIKKLYKKIAVIKEKNKVIALEMNENRKKKTVNENTRELKFFKGIGKMLTSVKNINLSYSETNSTILPGFNQTPKFLGFDESWLSPGLPFILGSQNPAIKEDAIRNNWLVQSDQQLNPFNQNSQKQFTIKTQLQPFKDFKIQLEAKKTKSANYSESFSFDEIEKFISFAPIRTGNYGISYFLLKTTFKKDDNNISPLYKNFQKNRTIIKDRLTDENPNANGTLRYTLNDQDVIIPSFIAAYIDKDARSIELSSFPKVPIPNWKVTYTGLSKIKGFKEKFNTFSITHQYSSKFEIGNYQSNDIYGSIDSGVNFDLSVSENDLIFPSMPIRSDTSIFGSIYTISQVVLSEQFAPLIGLNMKTKNNVQIKFDYKTGRYIALNISNTQISETKSSDIAFDLRFTKKGMNLPFKNLSGGTIVLKNDVIIRVLFAIRRTKTIQRRLDEDSQNGVNNVTAKNNTIQIKPSVTYKINKRADIQFYFNRVITDPNPPSFKRSNTAFGLQFRFNMAE